MDKMEELVTASLGDTTSSTLEWFKEQLGRVTSQPGEVTEEQEKLEQQQREKEAALQILKQQQDDISKKIAALQGNPTQAKAHEGEPLEIIKRALAKKGDEQNSNEVLLQQLKTALTGKKEEDPHKQLIKALITQQNKVPGEGGTSTLNPTLANKITSASSSTMADWLAGLNKQEESESEQSRHAQTQLRYWDDSDCSDAYLT